MLYFMGNSQELSLILPEQNLLPFLVHILVHGIKQEEEVAPVRNSQSQNCSSVSDLVSDIGTKSEQCSFSVAIQIQAFRQVKSLC